MGIHEIRSSALAICIPSCRRGQGRRPDRIRRSAPAINSRWWHPTRSPHQTSAGRYFSRHVLHSLVKRPSIANGEKLPGARHAASGCVFLQYVHSELNLHEISIPVPTISPSPWVAWRSPAWNSAPASKTGESKRLDTGHEPAVVHVAPVLGGRRSRDRLAKRRATRKQPSIGERAVSPACRALFSGLIVLRCCRSCYRSATRPFRPQATPLRDVARPRSAQTAEECSRSPVRQDP